VQAISIPSWIGALRFDMRSDGAAYVLSHPVDVCAIVLSAWRLDVINIAQ